MFETRRTLIVVYTDELLMNQLKKMIETHDDNEIEVVGTKDDSINVVSWTEKVWLGNKKAGNIQGKILFLGDIKGTDKLIPVIDEKFDETEIPKTVIETSEIKQKYYETIDITVLRRGIIGVNKVGYVF